MNRIVNKWLKIVQQLSRYCLALPCNCVLCLQPSRREIGLCEACESTLPWITQPCECCGLALEQPHTLCAACLNEHPPFERLSSLFDYAWPVNVFIGKLKYANQLSFGKMLGHLLAKRLIMNEKIDCIVAVPLHPNRQKQRGFNQCNELAQNVARFTQRPFDRWSCTKIIDTSSQALLSANQRAHNLKPTAFHIAPSFKAQHVLVIEDVVTTKATISAFSSALKNHGVQRVEIWSVCRTGSVR